MLTMLELPLLLLMCHLDTKAAPTPYVVVSDNRRFYAKVDPGPHPPVDATRATITAFAVQAAGSDQQIWQSTEWYGYNILLCNDGHHAVSLAGSGVTFYADGKLVKSYANADLGSEYLWGGWPLPSFGFVLDADRVRMTSVEGVERIFDVSSGEVVAAYDGVPTEFPRYRSLMNPPLVTPLQQLARNYKLLIGGAVGGLILGLGLSYVRWRQQQRRLHGA